VPVSAEGEADVHADARSGSSSVAPRRRGPSGADAPPNLPTQSDSNGKPRAAPQRLAVNTGASDRATGGAQAPKQGGRGYMSPKDKYQRNQAHREHGPGVGLHQPRSMNRADPATNPVNLQDALDEHMNEPSAYAQIHRPNPNPSRSGHVAIEESFNDLGPGTDLDLDLDLRGAMHMDGHEAAQQDRSQQNGPVSSSPIRSPSKRRVRVNVQREKPGVRQAGRQAGHDAGSGGRRARQQYHSSAFGCAVKDKHEKAEDKVTSEQRNERMIKTHEDQLFFSKKARPVNYKPCTLDQYKREKPAGWVELGKLQPDLNQPELVAKRANAARVKEFSKHLNNFNKSHMKKNTSSVQPKQDWAQPKPSEEDVSKRVRAKQFASKIPRPRARVPQQLSPQAQSPKGPRRTSAPNVKARPGRQRGGGLSSTDDIGLSDSGVHSMNSSGQPVSKLDKLEMRHDNARREVDRIRQELGI